MIIDMRKDAPDQSNSIDPDKLSTEVEKLQSIQNQIENLEAQVKDLKQDEKHFSCVVIPKLMEDMNLSSLKLKDGSELTVKQIYSATLKADKKAEGIHWLRDNGLGDIVKNNITVSFGQGEDNKAVDYAGLARSIQEEKVHPSTLKVVMKEWKDKGREVPEELFNTFDGSQTYLKNKK
jgi:acid stress-induced BolA-like protein IbaG/YrbA